MERGILIGLEQGQYKTWTPKLDANLTSFWTPLGRRKKTLDDFHSDVIKF